MQRILAAKEASLPQEPAADDENAVTLLVRMPDGSRHGRRFLKSDKLQVNMTLHIEAYVVFLSQPKKKKHAFYVGSTDFIFIFLASL